MTGYNELIDFLDEYVNHYRQLLDFENSKLSVLIENNQDTLKDSLGKEQALIMKGDSMETKRIALLKKMGLDGLTFTQIIDKSPKEYKTKLSILYNDLSKYVYEVKRVNISAMQNVELKLANINNKLNKSDSNTYDQHAKKQHISKSSMSLSKNI